MSQRIASGKKTLIMDGYSALEEANKSDGYGRRFVAGRYSDFEEAKVAARGLGVQGSQGEVHYYAYYLHEGGAVTETTLTVYGRDKSPDNSGYAMRLINQQRLKELLAMAEESKAEKTVIFEDETELSIGVTYCAFCLATELEPSKAVTLMGGNAVCGEHFYLKSPEVEFYASKYFENLRRENMKGDDSQRS